MALAKVLQCGLIALEYGSFFAIFQMVVTMAIPIFAAIGIAMQAYQNGHMDWMTSDSIRKKGSMSIITTMRVCVNQVVLVENDHLRLPCTADLWR